MGNTFVDVLKKWWIVLIIGIASLVLGIALAVHPGSGFEVARIVVVVNYLVLAAAAIAVIVARRDEIPAWGWDLAGAILLFALGVAAALTPGVSEGFLIALFIMGFLIEGISGISGSVALKRLGIPGWGWSMAFAVITVVVGVMLIVNPLAAVLSIDILVAAAMISFGISMIIISYKLSKIKGGLNVAVKKAEDKAERILTAVEQAAEEIEQQVAKQNGADDQ